MEQWEHNIGDPQGYEELVFCTDGQICDIAPYYRGPCICMVDIVYAGKNATVSLEN